MSHDQIIPAWKDPEYRRSLSEAERAALPENPVGLMELSGEQLDNTGGAGLFDFLSRLLTNAGVCGILNTLLLRLSARCGPWTDDCGGYFTADCGAQTVGCVVLTNGCGPA